MSIIQAVNLSKAYGAVDLFSDVSFGIPRHSRIALVGPNGIGKTTLLRLLIGEEDPSGGSVQRARNLRIGYLPQEARFESVQETLWQECLHPFQLLLDQQAALHRMEAEIAAHPEDSDLLTKYGAAQLEFDRAGGYTYENQIRMVLTGLGFTPADFDRPYIQLSGGQRTRALLARLLLSQPDLLLLDEPTNHLDIEAVEWLEKFLRDWPGALMFVSHDRFFIDQVADHVYELSPDFEIFRGNYSAYLLQREHRYQTLMREYEGLQTFVAKEEAYIRRNMAGQNTRQAQGRLKRLERLLAETDVSRPRPRRDIHLRLQAVNRSGDLVIRTHELQVGYADENRPLFQVPDLILKRGECAAILGPNGAGKTTFLKTILGQLPPFRGETELGSSLEIGYFSQAHEGLNPGNTLLQEINLVAPAMSPGEVRDYLAKFLFTGDDCVKPVSVLSGGERGRLALAKLALRSTNLLLLDEPTNHLDLPSQEVLQSVLGEYAGTILLVSHDRYLIDSLASQIWQVDPLERQLTVFSGSYSEYRAFLARESEQPAVLRNEGTGIVPASAPAPVHSSRLSPWKRQKMLTELEETISGLEAELQRLSTLLANPPADGQIAQQAGQDFVRVENELNELMQKWEKLEGGT